jgi:hypothetical protein
MNAWTRSERLALLGIIVAAVGSLAALAVIPELRVFLGLDERSSSVESMPEETPYQAQAAQQDNSDRIDPQIEVQVPNEEAAPQSSQAVGDVVDVILDHQGVADSSDSQVASSSGIKEESVVDSPSESPTVLAETEPEQPARKTYRSTSFSFDLFGCQRGGDRIQCSLTVRNLTGTNRGINLCRVSKIVDDMGRELIASVHFSGGNSCGLFRLEPDLPRGLEISAQVYAESRTLNIVFGEAVAFRDVPISGPGLSRE